jgi:hypothetical protein
LFILSSDSFKFSGPKERTPDKENISNKKYFFVVLLFLVMPSVCYSAFIEGRVFSSDGPVEGVMVYVYKDYGDLQAGKHLSASQATEKRGYYSLQVPDGEYYFTAKGSKDGKELFSYHGRNPLTVEAKNIWLSFMVNEVKPPDYSDGETSVKGIIIYKGNPVKDANVAFYTADTRRFKGLGTRTEHASEDGTFSLYLSPDKYVVIARKMEDNKLGPLNSGGLYCYYPMNPLEVRKNRIVSIEIPCYPKGERDFFSDAPVIKNNNYLTVENLRESEKFGIKGKITSTDGKPLSGIHVFAYKEDPSSVLIKKFYQTEDMEYTGRTDSDGKYFIPINSDGLYHIVVRSAFSGKPKTTEVFGLSKEGIKFKKGQLIENINITVKVNADPGN